MTVSASTLELLMATGLSGERLLEVVRAIEADCQRPSARSPGAERQRRYRERKAASDVTRDVTSDATPVTETATHSSQEFIPPSPPKGGSSPKGAAPAVRRARGSRFAPDDFTPSPAHHAHADVLGLTSGDFERALSRFRRHEFPRAYTDWSRCFMNWIDREKPPNVRPANDHKLAAKSDNLARGWAATDGAAAILADRRALR